MPVSIAPLAARLGANLPSRALLEQYRPCPAWFRRPESVTGPHGINHEARVLVWQELLARLLIQEGARLDQEALRWAAVTHDTQRVDDMTDAPHGQRAASWVCEHLAATIPAASLETVAYLNRWHVPEDWQAPRLTPELAVFKDADALDRVRLGGWRLDPAQLRYPQARRLLVPLASALVVRAGNHRRAGAALFESVLLGAAELGLVAALESEASSGLAR